MSCDFTKSQHARYVILLAPKDPLSIRSLSRPTFFQDNQRLLLLSRCARCILWRASHIHRLINEQTELVRFIMVNRNPRSYLWLDANATKRTSTINWYIFRDIPHVQLRRLITEKYLPRAFYIFKRLRARGTSLISHTFPWQLDHTRWHTTMWSLMPRIPLLPNVGVKNLLVRALDRHEDHRPGDTVQKYDDE